MTDLDNLDDAAEGEGECEEDDDDGEDDEQVGADTLALLASWQPSMLLSSNYHLHCHVIRMPLKIYKVWKH